MKVNNKTSLKEYDTDTKNNEIQSKNGSVLTEINSAINKIKQ